MKKYTIIPIIAGILVLVAGCRMQNDVKKHNTEQEQHTVLTIKNQSSFSIKNIKYNSQAVNLSEEFLSAGESCTVQLVEKANSYLYFTLYDEIKKTSFAVRSNNTIIVEKGKTEIFAITDNTLVIQTGQTQPIKLLSLIKPAILKVYNETAWSVIEISYGGKTYKKTIASGKEWETTFGDNMQHALTFTLLKKKDNTTVSLTLKDTVTIEIGKAKEVHITNTTLAVQEGKTEPEEIRQLLGGSVLNIINHSSADEISGIHYGGVTHTTAVLQNGTCKLELQDGIDDYLTFYVKAKYVTFKVKTGAKIAVESKEEKTITIDNNTDVIVLALKYPDEEVPTTGDDLTKVLKLQKVVDAALLDITNKSSAELLNVTYDNYNAGTIAAYDGKAEEAPWEQVDCWDFTTTATQITFDIKLPEKLIRLKTVEPIVLANSDKTKFTFTNKTKVIDVETGITTTIGKVIGLSSLTVVNGTTAKLSNFQYAEQKADTSLIVSQNEKWDVEFAKPVDDHLTFKIRNNDITVKTVNKISINSGEEKIFTITDNTAVIPSGAQDSTTVDKVLHAATLEITNSASVKLYNVKYGNRSFGDLTIESDGDASNALKYWDIKDTALPISFELQTPKKKVKVKTEETIKLTADDSIEFSITDATKLIVEESGKTALLRDIVSGISWLQVINQSTAKSISKIKFAEETHAPVIAQGEHCNFECKNAVEDYIYFTLELENDLNPYDVKTHDKISLAALEEKTFTLTDDTFIVIAEDSPPVKMSSFINDRKTYSVNGVSFTMRAIDAVTNTVLGNNDGIYQHDKEYTVSLSAYNIGTTEVTQELWQAVMGNNPSEFTSSVKNPVEKVSWRDCIEFCNKLTEIVMGAEHCVYTTEQTYYGISVTAVNFNKKGFRLPTEAEWEYAALGGTRNRWAGCNTKKVLDEYAWYKNNSDNKTHKVASKKPNGYGLYDMTGNVMELCGACEHYKVDGLQDPIGNWNLPIKPGSAHYAGKRGGSWDDDDWHCLVSNPGSEFTSENYNYLGLRLVCRP